MHRPYYKLVPTDWQEKISYPPAVVDEYLNKLPTPNEEVTWHEFHQLIICHSPKYIDPSRWITEFNHHATIYWFDNCGYAVIHPNKWTIDKSINKIRYEEEPRYFYLGCNHNYQELSRETCKELGIAHYGMCYHVTQCSKCNHFMIYDSSD